MQTQQTNSEGKESDLEERASLLIKAIDDISKYLPSIIIIHNITTGGIIYMSDLGLKELQISLDDIIKLGDKYASQFLKLDNMANYFPQILEVLKTNNFDETFTYFQQVRANNVQDWHWYLSTTKILMFDENDKAYLSITTSKPINNLFNYSFKFDKILEEKGNIEANMILFNQLTKREKQILILITDGKTTIEMAKLLHISSSTIEQHRKNIRKKLQIKNLAHLLKCTQSFDMI